MSMNYCQLDEITLVTNPVDWRPQMKLNRVIPKSHPFASIRVHIQGSYLRFADMVWGLLRHIPGLPAHKCLLSLGFCSPAASMRQFCVYIP